MRPSLFLIAACLIALAPLSFARQPDLLWMNDFPGGNGYLNSIDLIVDPNGRILHAMDDWYYDGRTLIQPATLDGDYLVRKQLSEEYWHSTVSFAGTPEGGYVVARDYATFYFGDYYEESYSNALFTYLDSSLVVLEEWLFSGSPYNGSRASEAIFDSSGNGFYAAVSNDAGVRLRHFDLQDLTQETILQLPDHASASRMAAWDDERLYMMVHGQMLGMTLDDDPQVLWSVQAGWGQGRTLAVMPSGRCVSRDSDGVIRCYTPGGELAWYYETGITLQDLAVQPDGRILFAGMKPQTEDSLIVGALTAADTLQWRWSMPVDSYWGCSIGSTPDGGCAVGMTSGAMSRMLRLSGRIGATLDVLNPAELTPAGGDLRLDLDVFSAMDHGAEGTVRLVATGEGEELPPVEWTAWLPAGADWRFEDVAYPVPAGLPLGEYDLAVRFEAGGWWYETSGEFTIQSVGVHDDNARAARPQAFAVRPVHPNPFNESAVVTVELPAPGTLTVTVYDLLGRPVRVLHKGPVATGVTALHFEAAGLPSGSYLVRASLRGASRAQRVTLIK